MSTPGGRGRSQPVTTASRSAPSETRPERGDRSGQSGERGTSLRDRLGQRGRAVAEAVSRPSTGTQPTTPPPPPPAAPVRGRRARLKVHRVDPWSVMKLAFLLSIAIGIVAVVAVFVLWSVLDSMGVFTSVGSTVKDLTGTDTTEGFDVVGFLSLRRVLGVTTLLTVVNIVLVTALATLGAFLYNVAASFAGGLEVTLTDD